MTNRIEAMNAFRERLQRSLTVRGMSQSELARVADIDRQAIGQMLMLDNKDRARRFGPKLWHLVIIADALHVDPAWLAFGRGTPPEASDG